MNEPLVPPSSVVPPPTSHDDDWSKMAYYVLKELERLDADAKRRSDLLFARFDALYDKVEKVVVQGAVTHAKVVLYGAVGGAVALTIFELLSKFHLG